MTNLTEAELADRFHRHLTRGLSYSAQTCFAARHARAPAPRETAPPGARVRSRTFFAMDCRPCGPCDGTGRGQILHLSYMPPGRVRASPARGPAPAAIPQFRGQCTGPHAP